MPARLSIDPRLLGDAMRVGGFRTKSEAVNRALAEFVRSRNQRSIIRHFGTVDFAAEFDYKKLRARG
jgi:hypothetical protein